MTTEYDAPALEGEELTTEQLSERTGVALATLKRWTNTVNIPHRRNSKGHKRYGPEALEAIEAIKNIKSQDPDIGMQSIRRLMSYGPAIKDTEPEQLEQLEATEAAAELEVSAQQAEPEPARVQLELSASAPRAHAEPAASPSAEAIAMIVTDRVVAAVRDNNEIAQSYAAAARQVGQLEERARLAEDRARALELERERLTSENEARASDVSRLAQELARAHGELEQIRAQLAAAPATAPPGPRRGWLARLLGAG